MNKKLSKILTISTLVCLALGILIGFLPPGVAKEIKFLGDWFIQTLKIIIGPMIFCSMAIFVLRRDGRKFLLGKTILLFIVMFVITFVISGVIVYFTKPGSYFKVEGTQEAEKYADFGIVSILKNLLPKSVSDVFTGKCIFLIIVVSLLIAFIISFTKAKDAYAKGMEFAKKYIDIVLKVVLALSPLAVLSLVSNMIVSYDVKSLQMGLTYILFALGLSVIALIFVMILPVWIFGKINPIKYIQKASKVWIMSLTTCSSAATLPYTVRCCNEDFGVDEKVTDLVVPLGCTIHMCGGAVSFSLLGLFVAQISGVTVTIPMFLLMLLSATLINMAAPGIPGGGVVIGITYLSIFNLPVAAFYGMYTGIYKILDMFYTTLNVTGDISANILLDRQEKRKALKRNSI